MTPSQLEHLRLIEAHLANLLSTAEKRTSGEWIADFNCTSLVFAKQKRGEYEVATVDDRQDAAFIASCAGNAEAGWKATRAAIAEILSSHEAAYEGWCLVAKELGKEPGSLEDYPLPPWSQHILAAFPLELIQKP